ncbi:hypothetical protein [Pseudomonas sp. UMAB-08]|uniref:hypothetical protein n=1 Tax=Pseudomonas sp. UMAB-08 TaxID=1365375 RepID=UPI00214C5F29|nr:hypothetical protein [Pseudomonas sp. UMAB-08]
MTTFQFPIRKADGSQFQDAEQLHKLLESETSGRYLLSNSGYWHGGIHISNESAPHCVFDEPVRCIADGEVVAYRLNKHYLTSYVGEGLDAPWLKYSTSFCLVRHHYQSPPNPEEGPNFGKQNELTFYSLYMHLLPFEEYQHDHPTKRLKVTHGDWPARDVPKGEPGSKILGNIPDNVVFDVIDGRLTPEGYYFSKGRIVKGQVGQQGVGAEVWFASEKDDQPIRNSQGRFRLWDITSRRAKPTYWLGLVDAVVKDPNGLEMYLPPQNKTFGTKPESEPRLPQNYRFRFDSEQAIPVKFDDGRIARTAPCTREVTHTRRDTIPLSFWAFIDDQTVEYPPDEPVHLDTVVVPQAPIPIKAGDPVGFLGLYELPDGAGKKTRHQVHLEVFTCDPQLDAFLNNEAGLKQGKQYLEVLRLQHAIVGRDRETTHPTYLFKDHLFDLKKLPVVKDESGEDCYKVSVLERARTPDTPLRTLDALVRKQSALEDGTGVRVISQHDLRAIGFKVVEQHQRDSCSPLNDESVCQFYAQLNALADVNSDGQVTADELRQTLKNPEFRDRWSKLVVRHHTEWQTQSDGASLQPFRDRLSHNPELLRHESERIDKLVFWDEVAVKLKLKLPVDGRVSYFHPVEFVGGLSVTQESKAVGRITFDAEGNDTPGSIYFSRVIHWPGNELSGVTLGRGYDMGSRSQFEVSGHMIAAGLDAVQASKIAKANGLKGSAVKEFVSNNKLNIGEITHEQQRELFDIVYPDYISRAVRNYNKWTAGESGRTEWDNLAQVIRDVLVDFVYQGFTQGANPMKAGMTNDIDLLIRYIESTPALSQYEPGRRRANYLRNNR